MTITAAADGSALGNPGPAGWAWYIDDDHWSAGGWPYSTNNRGELQAVLELFRATAHLDEDLHILCDSQYVINCVTKWMPGWKARGWRKADGSPVQNVDQLEELDEVMRGRRFRFEWVRGHTGHDLNEAADVRARSAAEAFQRGVGVPDGPGFPRGAAPHAERETTAASALFELEPDEPTELTIALSPEEWERLRARAHEAGTSPEDVLRSLI